MFTDSGSRWVASRPMVRRNRTYDFSNRFEFGLNVILDPSQIDPGQRRRSLTVTVDRSVPRRKNPLRKPTLLRTRTYSRSGRPAWLRQLGRSPVSGS